MKKLIAGNWKMNGTLDDAKTLIAGVINGIHLNEALLERCEFAVCPSFVHLGVVRHAAKTVSYVALGAQDCAAEDNGAYTGDISASMLKDGRCTYVILGHSERRQHHKESSELVSQKAQKAHKQGLITIICVGETEAERSQGKQEQTVAAQLKASIPPGSTPQNTVIAYEPVWAIGTGKNATPADIKSMHAFIREKLKEHVEKGQNIRILYGGSMKPENAGDILATENVDGGLIGGASLKADQFLGIAQTA